MVARLLWQVHAGVLDHHDSLWDTRPGKRGHAVRQRGMSEWLAEMISLAASREPPRRLLFIGLSFGAALERDASLSLFGDAQLGQLNCDVTIGTAQLVLILGPEEKVL